MKTPKTVECKPLLLIGALLMANLSQAQLDLKLDSDTPSVQNNAMPMMDSVLYNVDNDVMEVITEFPVLCTHISGYQPISDVQLKVYDPNNLDYPLSNLRDFNLGVAQDISYDLAGRSINIVSENRNKAKCITSVTDIIYDGGFEDGLKIEVLDGYGVLRYEGIPSSVIGNLNTIQYAVTYTNTSPVQQKFDYVDYWPQTHNENTGFDFNSALDWYLCNEDDPGVSCGFYNIGRIGEIRTAQLGPGRTLRITYEKTLIAPDDYVPGEYVNMMAGVFFRTAAAEGIDGVDKSNAANKSNGQVYIDHLVIENRIRVD